MLQYNLLMANLLSKNSFTWHFRYERPKMWCALIQRCCDRSPSLPDEDWQSLHCCDQTPLFAWSVIKRSACLLKIGWDQLMTLLISKTCVGFLHYKCCGRSLMKIAKLFIVVIRPQILPDQWSTSSGWSGCLHEGNQWFTAGPRGQVATTPPIDDPHNQFLQEQV